MSSLGGMAEAQGLLMRALNDFVNNGTAISEEGNGHTLRPPPPPPNTPQAFSKVDGQEGVENGGGVGEAGGSRAPLDRIKKKKKTLLAALATVLIMIVLMAVERRILGPHAGEPAPHAFPPPPASNRASLHFFSCSLPFSSSNNCSWLLEKWAKGRERPETRKAAEEGSGPTPETRKSGGEGANGRFLPTTTIPTLFLSITSSTPAATEPGTEPEPEPCTAGGIHASGLPSPTNSPGGEAKSASPSPSSVPRVLVVETSSVLPSSVAATSSPEPSSSTPASSVERKVPNLYFEMIFFSY